MEPSRSTFELHRGKFKESVEIRKVENGYIICHYPHMGPSKEYISETNEKAKEKAETLLGKPIEAKADLPGEPTAETKEEENPGKYAKAY